MAKKKRITDRILSKITGRDVETISIDLNQAVNLLTRLFIMEADTTEKLEEIFKSLKRKFLLQQTDILSQNGRFEYHSETGRATGMFNMNDRNFMWIHDTKYDKYYEYSSYSFGRLKKIIKKKIAQKQEGKLNEPWIESEEELDLKDFWGNEYKDVNWPACIIISSLVIVLIGIMLIFPKYGGDVSQEKYQEESYIFSAVEEGSKLATQDIVQNQEETVVPITKLEDPNEVMDLAARTDVYGYPYALYINYPWEDLYRNSESLKNARMSIFVESHSNIAKEECIGYQYSMKYTDRNDINTSDVNIAFTEDSYIDANIIAGEPIQVYGIYYGIDTYTNALGGQNAQPTIVVYEAYPYSYSDGETLDFLNESLRQGQYDLQQMLYEQGVTIEQMYARQIEHQAPAILQLGVGEKDVPEIYEMPETSSYDNQQAFEYADEGWEAEFIFPYSDIDIIPDDELEAATNEQLRIGKNEIYANHGRMFNSEDLQAYFDKCSWYIPSVDPDEFDESVLSETEKENIRRIQQEIDRRNQ